MDVGKWSGHNFNETPNSFMASVNNKHVDSKNFARITREFEQLKKDRVERSKMVSGIEANSRSGR